MRSMPACKPSPPHRDRRGVRYRLASLLMIGVLAQLAGQDSSRGMAHWAKLRTHELSQLFHLKRQCMPHYSTWSRVLGHGVEPNEVEQIVGRFFDQAVRTAHRKRADTSAPPNDCRRAQTVEKGHGRIEKRTITVSSMLADYSTWPELAQVFKLESQRTDALGITKTEVRYGVTSLPVYLATPKRLLALSRGHWRIENGLHYRRNTTIREDHAQLRMGHAPEMLAVLTNAGLGLFARQGASNVAHPRRHFTSHFAKPLPCVLSARYLHRYWLHPSLGALPCVLFFGSSVPSRRHIGSTR